MRLFLIIIVFAISHVSFSQKANLTLLQDNDNYKLYYDLSDLSEKSPIKYQIVKENKNPNIKNGFLVYEFQLIYDKTIHRDSLMNYNSTNIDDLNFEKPYEVHEFICNNSYGMLIILKEQENPDGRFIHRFDESDKYELRVYQARYVGTRYGN